MGRGRVKSIGGAGWPGGEHPGEFRLLGVPVFEFQHEVGEFRPGFRNNVIRYLNGLFFRHMQFGNVAFRKGFLPVNIKRHGNDHQHHHEQAKEFHAEEERHGGDDTNYDGHNHVRLLEGRLVNVGHEEGFPIFTEPLADDLFIFVGGAPEFDKSELGGVAGVGIVQDDGGSGEKIPPVAASVFVDGGAHVVEPIANGGALGANGNTQPFWGDGGLGLQAYGVDSVR